MKQQKKTIDYDAPEKGTGNTETHIAVDEQMRSDQGNDQLALNEGFASASGVRPETAESGGRILHPEEGDHSVNDHEPKALKDENPGLADS